MDLRTVEEIANEKSLATPKLNTTNHQTDPNSALQSFLDHIPVSSIPGIRSHSTVLELAPDVYVRDAIGWLYDGNVSGAPVVDNMSTVSDRLTERDIGFVEFSSMVLWCLEEIGNVGVESKNGGGFLEVLERIPEIGRTRIAELAKSFLWEPFFPVHLEDTLFHVLLLFSKHPRLHVVPVITAPNSHVLGFVAQRSVVQLLLQCDGLEWFDQIAHKPLSEIRFEHSGVVRIYADQTLAEAFHVLWERQVAGAPVVDRRSGVIVGSVKTSDAHLLLEDDNLFNNRKNINVVEYIKAEAGRIRAKVSAEDDAGVICLKDSSIPARNAVVTNRRSDSLTQAMKKMVASKSDCSFLVSESGQLEGLVTLRDIISQFSPPSMDSRIDGGGFFNTALGQAGCHVENGSLIQNS